MKVVAPILMAAGLLLIIGSMFIGRSAPTTSEEEAAVHEKAVTDLHNIANEGQDSEGVKARVAEARDVLQAADDQAAAALARSKWLSSIMKIAGLLVTVCGAGLHFYLASLD